MYMYIYILILRTRKKTKSGPCFEISCATPFSAKNPIAFDLMHLHTARTSFLKIATMSESHAFNGAKMFAQAMSMAAEAVR